MTKNLADELQRSARAALTSLQPAPQGEEAGGLSFQRLLAAAFRARYLLFGTTLFGLLVGTFLAITTANSYLSTGTFVLTGSGAEKLGADPTRTAEMSQETIATSATYILATDDLLKKVINRLGPARILEPYNPGGDDSSAWKALFFRIQRDWNKTREEDRTADEALKHLKRTIHVERPKYTDVLLATCTANSPGLAKEILATYMAEGIKTHIEKYDSTRAYEESQRAFEDAQSKHTLARNAMREFLERKAQVDDFDMEKKRLQLDAGEGAVQVTKLEADVQVKGKLIEELKRKLTGPDAVPQYVTEKIKPGLNSEAITKKETELIDLYQQLATLQQQLADPNDNQIGAKRGQIDAAKMAIEQMRKTAREAEPVEVSVLNPIYKGMQEDLGKYEAQMATAATELTLMQQQQTRRSARLRQLLVLEPEYEALRATKLHAETSETAARFNKEQMEQKRLLGAGNFSALKEVEPATLPLEKEGPNRGKLLLGGLLVGLFFGLGIIVLRALPDTVVRTRNDLEQIEGLAVIGMMPRLDNKNLRRHEVLREQGW
ncbi:MAG: hypothetical protein WAT39_25380 [Planctomycetota bacterium]